MQLPRKVTIEGVEYLVQWMSRTKEFEGLYGMIFMEDEERGPNIFINYNLSLRQRYQTLLHEIIHAVLDPLKLNSNHDERLTRRLEEGLTSAIEENPTLFRDLVTILRRTRRRTRSR